MYAVAELNSFQLGQTILEGVTIPSRIEPLKIGTLESEQALYGILLGTRGPKVTPQETLLDLVHHCHPKQVCCGGKSD